MSAHALYFGPEERRLFGWLHLPDGGTARAGVVLCQPVGYEYVSAHRTFRVLAEDLAAAGFAAIRFDYDGTGDSAGDHRDPGRVDAWTGSVRAATEVLRKAGASTVGAVGMRLGATLAAAAVADGEDLAALVLWDPAWSGKAFVRQLRALHMLGLDGAGASESGDGSMAVAGTVYTAETVAELRALASADLHEWPSPVLLLQRPDRPAPAKEVARLPAGTPVEDTIRQDALLDHESSIAQVPRQTVAQVVRWLGAVLPEGRTPVTAPAPVTVSPLANGLSERLCTFGDVGLFGVVTEGAVVPERPTVLLLNNATDHHIGPNRLWVDWGRELAAAGWRVARVDFSGIGDSPTRPGEGDDHSYPVHGVDDVRVVADALGDVVTVGLCSGARLGIEAGRLGIPVGVCAINPSIHTRWDRLVKVRNDDPQAVLAVDPYKRIPHHVKRRLPRLVWRALDALRVSPSRARSLQELVDGGVDTLLLYGAGDFFLTRLNETSSWHLDRLKRHPKFRFATVDGLDHALMAPVPRDELVAVLEQFLLERFA
jgi:pimeloyl-ACP methyl ester carboxylesterase